MNVVLKVVQSTPFRIGFLLLALAAAIWAVAENWDTVLIALNRIPVGTIAFCFVISVAYVVMTMLSWCAVLDSTGEPVGLVPAARIFFVSQLAKYLPGGLWNFLAAAELGVEHRISRRRSVSVLAVSVLISIVTGLVVAASVLILGPSEIRRSYWWLILLLPVGIAALTPPVLNRTVAVALRMTRRDPLEKGIEWRDGARASLWSLAGWVLAGTQVWLMLSSAGQASGLTSYSLAVGGYALGWIAGFLVFFAPAGVGVREAVLGAVLATSVDSGTVVVVVLLSRVLITLADITLGVGALALTRPSRPTE